MDERQIAVVMAKVRVGAVKILNGHPDYYGVPNHAIREGLGE